MNCPTCGSDSKDLKGGFSVCKKCGNVYVPISEITKEYPPKVSTTLEDTYMVEDSRLLIELIYNFTKDDLTPILNESGENDKIFAGSLSNLIQEKFEIKKKEKK